MKDFDYESEDAKNLLEEAIVANIIKSVIFNGKVAYRIVRTDPVADDTIFIPETQEVDCHEENNATVTIEDIQISSKHQRRSNVSISAILEKFCSSLEAINKQRPFNFYTELLKNLISELEKQLREKNLIIELISAQIIAKPPHTNSINRSDNYRQPTNDTNKSNHDDVSLEKFSNERITKEVIITNDSILNNVNSRGLSKSKKFELMNFLGAHTVPFH